MKKLRNIAAVIMAAALVLSLAACHPKDEVAVTVTDKSTKLSVDVTTAQYLYAMTQATLEAQNNIKNNNSDKTITDYTKYKVEEQDDNGKTTKTEYYKWINNRAEEVVRDYAASELKRKALKLKLDDSTKSNVDSYAGMYWSNYYQPIYEQNGVGEETFKKMFLSSYYKNQYFLSIYDTKGTEEIPEKDVKDAFSKNYCLANAITITVSSDSDSTGTTATDSSENKMTMAEAEAKLKKYKDRISKGEKFDTIYSEYQKETSTDSSSTSTGSAATVFGSSDTSYSSDYFDDAFKMKTGAVKILKNSDNTEIALVEKQDISKDEDTYYKNYRTDVLQLLKGDEFEDNYKKYYDGLSLEFHKYASGRVKAKKIKATASTSSAS